MRKTMMRKGEGEKENVVLRLLRLFFFCMAHISLFLSSLPQLPLHLQLGKVCFGDPSVQYCASTLKA